MKTERSTETASVLKSTTHWDSVKKNNMYKNAAAAAFVLLVLICPSMSAQSSEETLISGLKVDGDIDLLSHSFFAEIAGKSSGIRHLALTSDAMTVVIDHNYAENYPQLQEDSSTASDRTLYEGPGRVVTDTVREGHKITLVVEDAAVTLRSSGAEFDTKATEQVIRSGGYTPERREEVFELGPQFRLKDLEGVVRVQGNFSFSLYEWDGIIENSDGRSSFWTGERFTPLEPMQYIPEDEPFDKIPKHYGGRVDWQAAYVYVENGTLEFELRAEDDGSAYFMSKATGTTSGNFKVTPFTENGEDAPTVHFQGAYESIFDAPAKNKLAASFSRPSPPSPSSQQPPQDTQNLSDDLLAERDPVDHSPPLSIPTPSLPGSELPSWSYLVAVPALILTAGGVAYVRPIRRMHKLEDAYDLGIHGYVVDNAPALLRSRRFGVQASLMYTVSLLEERGPDEAEAHLLDVRPRSRPEGATYDYLMARIRAAQTRFDEARGHVHACLSAEPAFVMEVKRNAMLEFLMRPPSDPGEGYA